VTASAATPAIEDADTERGDPTYSFKPSLLGSPSEFTLKPEGLAWSVGRYSGMTPYDRIRRVRLSFRPITMQSHRFLAEIWPIGGPKLQISSCTWRSMVEQARQDAAYGTFIAEFHRRLAAAGTSALLSNGLPRVIFGLGVLAFIAITLAMGVLAFRGLQLGEYSGAALIGGLFLLFVWQVGGILYRNRPGNYRPDALPRYVLPRRDR
jgi:hypothetical protein